MKWEIPRLIPFNTLETAEGRWECGGGTGVDLNCRNGATPGSECNHGNSAQLPNGCISGTGTRGACGGGNGPNL